MMFWSLWLFGFVILPVFRIRVDEARVFGVAGLAGERPTWVLWPYRSVLGPNVCVRQQVPLSAPAAGSSPARAGTNVKEPRSARLDEPDGGVASLSSGLLLAQRRTVRSGPHAIRRRPHRRRV